MAKMSPKDQQKAKDAYSIHQDNLLWSRAQTLIAIQGAVLVATYSSKAHLELAVPLMFLGVMLTFILWLIAERDQIHRNAAFGASGIDPTPPHGANVGGWLIRLVFVLMLETDAYLLIWILLACDAVWPEVALRWLGFGFAVAVLIPALCGMAFIGWKLLRMGWGILFPKP